MGGLYSNAAATALEDCPEAARGIISGMLQQGHTFCIYLQQFLPEHSLTSLVMDGDP
jgi:ATP-dependent protease HslVU (ClpYQ) peptidase subunit